ncbi:TPA: DUF433 domain-containing protein [Candidatus Woesearchaeota archaeon]|nr:DUF433 domain-containing protein [Candidatus Woesearchaeota archaeon]
MTERIVINPKILAGKPIIKGTRISVEFVLELLSSGMSTHNICKEYPHLTKEDILAALEYATQVLRHEEVYPSASQEA